MLEVRHRFGALTKVDLVRKRDELRRCDDRTAGENALLKALETELTAPVT